MTDAEIDTLVAELVRVSHEFGTSGDNGFHHVCFGEYQSAPTPKFTWAEQDAILIAASLAAALRRVRDACAPKPITEAALVELDRLEGEATPGPWAVEKEAYGNFLVAPNGERIQPSDENSPFVAALRNACRPLLDALAQCDALIHILTQDGSAAFDLGKQIGRGEALAAFDECAADNHAIHKIRAAILAAGTTIKTPPDRARSEAARLRAALVKIRDNASAYGAAWAIIVAKEALEANDER